jgi:hypothetical protein
MTPRAKKALQGSIEKWEKIVTGAGQDHGDLNCALCKEFNTRNMPDPKRCIGCPVRAKTGLTACEGTPYNAYMKATESQVDGYAYSVAARKAALAMLRFLESLR